MRFRFAGGAAAVVVLSAWTSFAADVTGTYLVEANDSVALIQLVETSNGDLAGQFQMAAVGEDGRINSAFATITGIANAGSVSLSLTGTPAPLANLFGTADGQTLHLNGPAQFGALDFTRSDPSKFQEAYSVLQVHSERMLADIAAKQAQAKAEQVERDFMIELVKLLPEIDTFNASSGKRFDMIKAYGNKFASFTPKMAVALEREKGMAGIEQTSYQRGQIAYEIGQAQFEADSLHFNFTSQRDELREKIARLSQQIQPMDERCKLIAPPTHQNPAIVETSAGIEACRHLVDSEAAFRENVAAVFHALDDSESICQGEQRKQKAIVAEASRLN